MDLSTLNEVAEWWNEGVGTQVEFTSDLHDDPLAIILFDAEYSRFLVLARAPQPGIDPVVANYLEFCDLIGLGVYPIPVGQLQVFGGYLMYEYTNPATGTFMHNLGL